MRIIFFGSSPFAVPALDNLLQNDYNIVAVVTQPDKPVGKNMILSPVPLANFASHRNLQVLKPLTLRDDSFYDNFASLVPDICIVAAYGKILPDKYLNMPKFGFVNIHPSLLPIYRGPSPIQSAIMNGESETGVTIMILDAEMDHGPILTNKEYLMDDSKYFTEIHDELSKMGADLLGDTLPKYVSGEIKPVAQDHRLATFTKLLGRNDGRIDWKRPVEEIYNQIRALNPEPGTWTIWDNQILNIKKAKPLKHSFSGEYGLVRKHDNNIVVVCDGSMLILELIQLAGKKEMTAKDFLNGHFDFLDSHLV